MASFEHVKRSRADASPREKSAQEQTPRFWSFETDDAASIRALVLADSLSGLSRTSLMEQHPSPGETPGRHAKDRSHRGIFVSRSDVSPKCCHRSLRATHGASGRSMPIVEPHRPFSVLSEDTLGCGPGRFSHWDRTLCALKSAVHFACRPCLVSRIVQRLTEMIGGQKHFIPLFHNLLALTKARLALI